VPGPFSLDDFEGLLMGLVTIGAIVFIIRILISDSFW
jgi:hypothetical protein